MIKKILIITLFIVLFFSSVYSHSLFDKDDQQKNIRMSLFMAGNDMFDGYFKDFKENSNANKLK